MHFISEAAKRLRRFETLYFLDSTFSMAALLFLTCLPIAAWSVEPVEEVDEAVWIQGGVEAVRVNCGHTPGNIRVCLEEYDSKLVCEYFRHFEPRDCAADMKGGIRDMEWKLMGLAMYGDKSDLEAMKRLESVLSRCPTEKYGQLIQKVARPALMAREGGWLEVRLAMWTLAQVPQWFLYDSLLLSGGSAARDKLLERGIKPSLEFNDRYEMLSALRILDDPRRMELLIAPDFVVQAKFDLQAQDDETFLERVAGNEGAPELRKLKSVEALRNLAKQGYKLPPRLVRKKTVRGGIDWSKYWKQSKRPSVETAPTVKSPTSPNL